MEPWGQWTVGPLLTTTTTTLSAMYDAHTVIVSVTLLQFIRWTNNMKWDKFCETTAVWNPWHRLMKVMPPLHLSHLSHLVRPTAPRCCACGWWLGRCTGEAGPSSSARGSPWSSWNRLLSSFFLLPLSRVSASLLRPSPCLSVSSLPPLSLVSVSPLHLVSFRSRWGCFSSSSGSLLV